MPASHRRTAAFAVTLAALLGATASAARAVPPAPADDPRDMPRAQCRTAVVGSTGTARCFNPNGTISRVRLHIECSRWYDPDVDTRAVPVGPAGQITVAGRCWQEIEDLWVSQDPG
ncbi:hypothetical protein AB0D04_21285 [Streptomyces sp. NPDC048483]|uniref:hypothetical protein n=1 Tax=Streptomyces sp. NPDC048483 TaxID=3154927 RepID=UPI00343C5AF8